MQVSAQLVETLEAAHLQAAEWLFLLLSVQAGFQEWKAWELRVVQVAAEV